MFIKLCLKSVCNFVNADSLVPEKSDDHSLIILDLKRTLNERKSTKWENNYAASRILESDLIYLTFRTFHTLEINFRERRAPDFSLSGRDMYLSTKP
jgi:hypothetical protein